VPTLLAELDIRLSDDALHTLCAELDPANSGGVTKASFQLWWINYMQANSREHGTAGLGASTLAAAGQSGEAVDPANQPAEEIPQSQHLLSLEIPDVSEAL
jgi:hypothetical protein